MFVSDEPNSLVSSLDIVVVDANPHIIEGGSSDSDPSLPPTSVTITSISVTYPFTATNPITMTEYAD